MEVQMNNSVPRIRLGLLERADGSAEYFQDGNCVVASVFGPAPVKSKQEKIDAATIDVTVESLNTPTGLAQNSLALRIQTLLERLVLTTMHPRSLISVAVQPVKIDRPECLFVDSFNASIAALVDGGIPMSSIPVAVRVNAGVEAVFAHSTKPVTLVSHDILLVNGVDADQLDSLLATAQELSTGIFQVLQKTIYDSYSSQDEQTPSIDLEKQSDA